MDASEQDCPCCSGTATANAGKCRLCGEQVPTSELLSPAPDVMEAAEVYETLVALCDKSLVTFDAETGRFQLLDSIRQYAGLRLQGADDRRGTLARHGDFYLSPVNFIDGKASHSARMAVIQADLDNVRQALDWSSRQGPEVAERGLAMAAYVQSYWSLRGLVSECCCWLRRLLDVPAGAPSRARAIALSNLGEVERIQGDDAAAREHLNQAIAMLDPVRDGGWRAFALNNLGWLEMLDGNLEAAFALHEQAAEAAGIGESIVQQAFSATRMAAVAIAKGDLSRARSLLDTAIEQWRETSLVSGTAHALVYLAQLQRLDGDHKGAEETLRECDRLCMEVGDLRIRVLACEEMAELALASGEPARAASLLGLLERLRPESGYMRHRSETIAHRERLDMLRQALGERRLEMAMASGRESRRDYRTEEGERST